MAEPLLRTRTRSLTAEDTEDSVTTPSQRSPVPPASSATSSMDGDGNNHDDDDDDDDDDGPSVQVALLSEAFAQTSSMLFHAVKQLRAYNDALESLCLRTVPSQLEPARESLGRVAFACLQASLDHQTTVHKALYTAGLGELVDRACVEPPVSVPPSAVALGPTLEEQLRAAKTAYMTEHTVRLRAEAAAETATTTQSRLQAETDSHAATATQLQAVVARLEDELADKTQHLEAAQALTSQLQTEMETLRASQDANLKTSTDAAEAALRHAREEIETTRQTTESEMARRHKEAMEKLEGRHRQAVESLEAAVSAAETSAATANARMETLTADLTTERSQRGASEANLRHVTTDLDAARESLTDAQSQLQDSTQKVAELEGRLAELEATVARYDGQDETLAGLRADVATKTAQLESATSALTASEDQSSELESRLTSVTAQLTQLRDDLRTADEAKGAAEARAAVLTDRVDSLEAEVTAVRGAHSDAVDGLRQDMADAEAQFRSKLDTAERTRRDQLGAAELRRASDLEAAEQRSAADMAALEARHKADKEAVEARHGEAAEEADIRIAALTTANDGYAAEVKRLRGMLAQQADDEARRGGSEVEVASSPRDRVVELVERAEASAPPSSPGRSPHTDTQLSVLRDQVETQTAEIRRLEMELARSEAGGAEASKDLSATTADCSAMATQLADIQAELESTRIRAAQAEQTAEQVHQDAVTFRDRLVMAEAAINYLKRELSVAIDARRTMSQRAATVLREVDTQVVTLIGALPTTTDPETATSTTAAPPAFR